MTLAVQNPDPPHTRLSHISTSPQNPLFRLHSPPPPGEMNPFHTLVNVSVERGDEEAVVTRKRRLLVWHIIMLCMSSVVLLFTLTKTPLRDYAFMILGMSLALVTSLVSLTTLLYFKKHSNGYVMAAMWGYTVAAMFSDVYNVMMDVPRFWPAFMVFMDLILIFRVSEAHTRMYLLVLVVYLIVVELELVVKFGLGEFPGLPPQERRREDICGCENLPCESTATAGVSLLVGQVFIFLMDFNFTRGFATQVLQEKERVEASVQTAKLIATSLASFDLDAADTTLRESSSHLPDELEAAFRTVLANLTCYRPYLPDALFQKGPNAKGSTIGDELPPGRQDGEAALVFTDIKGSTSLWEMAPEAMKKALRIHNTIIRNAITEYDGYEVKTIGDAFMVAFSDPVYAVNFAMMVQEDLLAAVWPERLLQLPQCAPDGSGLWGGIVLRIGVNFGSVNAEINEITGRTDYFGHTVNTAARLEGKCTPGCVALPDTLYRHIRRDDRLRSHASKEMGYLQLAGVSEPMSVHCLVPDSLKGRCEVQQMSITVKKAPNLEEDSISRVVLTSVNGLVSTPCATVGAVRIAFDGVAGVAALDDINAALSSIITAADRTEGVPSNLHGTVATFGWNTARPCRAHIETSLRFARLCYNHSDLYPLHIGLSSSQVVTGNVGSSGQKYMLLSGPCVERSAQLAYEAESEGNAFGFYAPLTIIAQQQAEMLCEGEEGEGEGGEGEGEKSALRHTKDISGAAEVVFEIPSEGADAGRAWNGWGNRSRMISRRTQ